MSADDIPPGDAPDSPGVHGDQKMKVDAFAKIRLDGPRFEKGRLPISALVELERYERLVREVAAAEWRAENPERSYLPKGFRSAFNLAITAVEEGSATPVLERDSASTPYERYYAQAADTVDAAFNALVSGFDLPESFDWTNSGDFRTFGDTLEEGDAIELRPGGNEPIRYTPAVRRAALPRLIAYPVIEDDEPRISEGAVAGRLVALDAEDRWFRLRHPVSETAVTGRYVDPELTSDLRAVLDSNAVAPVVRVTGNLRTIRGSIDQVDAHFVELFEVDGGHYSRRLIELATLSSGWLEGVDGDAGELVAFTALEAARDLLRELTRAGIPLPGIFPLEDGGVQLEWASPEQVTSVEVSPDVHFELMHLVVAGRVSDDAEASDIEGALAFLRRVVAP
ncbi:hypothetical protein [Modestobacter sp. SYSU DS0511]